MRKPKNFHSEPFDYHEEIECVIEDLTNLGDGIGRVNGWVVMVPFTLPGERVRARIWRNKASYSEGDLSEIVEPSPDRVEPVCPLFGTCGGCQYQHLSYPRQLDWKTRQIRELLRRIGGIETEVEPCIGSPKQYGYRSKITPHFRKVKEGRPVAIGFERAANRAIVDVPQCPIASPAINEALPQEREKLFSGSKKFRRGSTLLLRDSEEGVITDMKAITTERIGSRPFQFVAGEFFQNNPHILPKMVEHAIAQAAAGGARYLVDAYCGVGVFALCASEHFERIAGVEVNPTAIQLARANAKIQSVDNVRFAAGSAEAIFEGLDFPAEETAVILDPPRKGCDEVFLQQLFDFGPPRVVYVSCGPDTQARDLVLFLKAGYEIERVQPFDLFPQTRHIENVVTLQKRA